MHALRNITFVAPLLLAACGAPSPAADPSAVEPSEERGDGAGDAPAQDRHADFVAGCINELPGADAYCECSWVEFRALFTDEEMDGEANPTKLQKLQDRVSASCTATLPEERIQASFLRGCSAGTQEREGYCGCMYVELRKDLTAPELANDKTVDSPTFLAARKKSVKVCGPKLPEKLIKDEFMTACAKQPELEKYCTCAWKVVRSKASPAEVDSNEADMATIKPLIDKNCAAHRP